MEHPPAPLRKGDMKSDGRLLFRIRREIQPKSKKKRLFLKKSSRKVCKFGKKPYLCIAFETRDIGRLAQLVQSICLTSRGSAVRIRQRPPKSKHRGVEQLVARWAHNPKVVCSSQASATIRRSKCFSFFYVRKLLYPFYSYIFFRLLVRTKEIM